MCMCYTSYTVHPCVGTLYLFVSGTVHMPMQCNLTYKYIFAFEKKKHISSRTRHTQHFDSPQHFKLITMHVHLYGHHNRQGVVAPRDKALRSSG